MAAIKPFRHLIAECDRQDAIGGELDIRQHDAAKTTPRLKAE
jgi:hypothetical protein